MSISYSDYVPSLGGDGSVPDGPNKGLLLLDGLLFNLADNMEQCLSALERSGLNAFPQSTQSTPVVVSKDGNSSLLISEDVGRPDEMKWCNATWDSVLCWPPTQANTSVILPCPPLKGLDPTKSITKFCHASGRWMGRTEDDFSRSHGWTNFTMCFTQEVVSIMKNLDNGTLTVAQDVAKNARKLEFVGLGLSFCSLALCILIFSCFRRLRVFRNLMHLQLMIAILAVVVIRLILYIDLIFTDQIGHVLVNPEGKTINTMVVLCETMFFLLEYFKSVAFWWMFLEGLYLHNQLVFAVFNTHPRLWPYLLAGYGIPFVHTLIWLIVIVIKKRGKVERCLGSYYLEPEFWILDGPRLLQLVINTIFISNVIRVLWSKVRGAHSSASEVVRMKKSVKAALMLIPLLGIPNIMQTIPFSPTQENIVYFTIWTYLASFTYMYQGFIVSVIYCFTNREVRSVLKSCYERYKLQHSTTMELRRGSRGHYSSPYGRRHSSKGATMAGLTTSTLDQGATLMGKTNGAPNMGLARGHAAEHARHALLANGDMSDGGGAHKSQRKMVNGSLPSNGPASLDVELCPRCSNAIYKSFDSVDGHENAISFADDAVDESGAVGEEQSREWPREETRKAVAGRYSLGLSTGDLEDGVIAEPRCYRCDPSKKYSTPALYRSLKKRSDFGYNAYPPNDFTATPPVDSSRRSLVVTFLENSG